MIESRYVGLKAHHLQHLVVLRLRAGFTGIQETVPYRHDRDFCSCFNNWRWLREVVEQGIKIDTH